MVFNTFQMYLQGNLDNLECELAHARDGGYILGAKVVRGAYIHTETEHARQHGLPLPILDSKESTDVQYDAAIALLLRNIGSAALVVATHNSASVEKAMSEMQRLAIDKSSTRVNFAQLMGMCEDLTLSLGTSQPPPRTRDIQKVVLTVWSMWAVRWCEQVSWATTRTSCCRTGRWRTSCRTSSAACRRTAPCSAARPGSDSSSGANSSAARSARARPLPTPRPAYCFTNRFLW